jgi:hypothetical protein
LQTTLGSEIHTSPQFRISNSIFIEPSLSKNSYDPGETVKFTLIATKENGESYSGDIQISNFTEENRNYVGSEEISIETSEDIAPGRYRLDIEARDGFNNGSTQINFNINQIPTKLSFGVNTLEVIPGESLTITGEVLDQVGNPMYGEIELEIRAQSGLITEDLFNSRETKELYFPYDYAPGELEIIATSGELRDEILLTVIAQPHLTYNLNESALTVTNKGNAIFQGDINISIGDIKKEVYLNLKPTASKRFILTAPSGDYEIIVGDNPQGSTFLTGNAVSVKDSETVFNSLKPLIWLIIIMILASVGLVLISKNQKTTDLKEKTDIKTSLMHKIVSKVRGKNAKKYTKKVSNTIMLTNKNPGSLSIEEKNLVSEDKSMKDLTVANLKTAEQSLVLKGEKTKSTVAVLKIEDFNNLDANARKELDKLPELIKKNHPVMEQKQDGIYFIFHPQVTKTFKNEILAVKSAIAIKGFLDNHNKKFRNKINYGIGINSGDLITNLTRNKLKYTALENTIGFARKLASSKKFEILTTDEIRKKLLREITTEKAGLINKKIIYTIKSMKDLVRNQEKLKDILKRIE